MREELAKERPVLAGLRSRDEDTKEWWGLTNTWSKHNVYKHLEEI